MPRQSLPPDRRMVRPGAQWSRHPGSSSGRQPKGAVATTASNPLSGGEVAFVDDLFANSAGSPNTFSNVLVSGTLTEVALDAVFGSGFE